MVYTTSVSKGGFQCSVLVFETRNINKCVFPVWRAERTYLCTKNANKSVFGYLVWLRLKCAMPKKCGSAVARRMRIPLQQKC